MSKSCWITLCVWSVIFILGEWEQGPEIAQRHAGVKAEERASTAPREKQIKK